MDIHITEIDTGARLTLCMLPESVKHSGNAAFQNYDVINVGEIKLPWGTALLTFSWSGMLPGESRKSASYVKSQYWQAPAKVLGLWEKWRQNGTKLRLMVTETTINCDVFLDRYEAQAYGGNGDYKYTISFLEAKDIKIYTVAESGITTSSPAPPTETSRPASPKSETTADTYTVVSGDSLWRIAQKKLGDGTRWAEIYNLNQDKIPSSYMIHPGQVLTLPS